MFHSVSLIKKRACVIVRICLTQIFILVFKKKKKKHKTHTHTLFEPRWIGLLASRWLIMSHWFIFSKHICNNLQEIKIWCVISLCLLPMKAAQCSARPSFLSKALMLAPFARRRFTIWQGERWEGKLVGNIIDYMQQAMQYVWAEVFVFVCVCVWWWSLYNHIVNTSHHLASVVA